MMQINFAEEVRGVFDTLTSHRRYGREFSSLFKPVWVPADNALR